MKNDFHQKTLTQLGAVLVTGSVPPSASPVSSTTTSNSEERSVPLLPSCPEVVSPPATVFPMNEVHVCTLQFSSGRDCSEANTQSTNLLFQEESSDFSQHIDCPGITNQLANEIDNLSMIDEDSANDQKQKIQSNNNRHVQSNHVFTQESSGDKTTTTQVTTKRKNPHTDTTRTVFQYKDPDSFKKARAAIGKL